MDNRGPPLKNRRMAARTGAVHVATTKRVYQGKTCVTHLLRRSIRQGKTVTHQTLGNLRRDGDTLRQWRRGGPEIGRMGMRHGPPSQLPTPGPFDQRSIGGSISWRTGQIFATEGRQRDEKLFLAHLEDPRGG
jgi:hypothetical protein